MSSQDVKATVIPKNVYRKPIILATVGTFVPLTVGFALAILSRRPQCPDVVAQAEIDSGSCIIGADMSLIWVFLAIPVVLVSLAVALLWATVIRRRFRQQSST